MASKMQVILTLQDNFTNRIKQATAAQAKFVQGAQAASKASAALSGGMTNVSAAAGKVIPPLGRVGGVLYQVGGRMVHTGNEARRFALQLVGISAAALGVHAALTSMRDIMKDSVKQAAQLDTVTRNVGGLAKATPVEMQQYQDIMRNLSLLYPKQDEQIGELLFSAVGSGFADAGMEGLASIAEIAVKGASAGRADPQEMMKLLATGLNAYYTDTTDKVNNAAKFMDIMFRTIDLGIIEAPDLAAHLGNVMGTAAQMGVPWEDVGTSMALLTRKGISPSESVTAFNRFLLSFMNPSDQAQDVIDAYGLDFSPTTIARLGMVGTLQQLAEKFDLKSMTPEALSQMSDEELTAFLSSKDAAGEDLVTLFGDVRGLKAALALAAENADAYEDLRGEMDGYAGSTDRMLQYQQESAEYQYGVLKNVAEFVKTDLGQAFLGFAGGPLEKFNEKMRYVLGHEDYKNADIFTKMRILGLNLTNWTEDWFWGTDKENLFDVTTGKEQVTQWGQNIGRWLGDGIRAILTGGDEGTPSVFADIGKTAWEGFKQGFGEGWDWSALIPDTKTEAALWAFLSAKLGIPQMLLKWLIGGMKNFGNGTKGGGGAAGMGVATMNVTAGVVNVRGGGGRTPPTGNRGPTTTGGGRGGTGGGTSGGGTAGKIGGGLASAGSWLKGVGGALFWAALGYLTIKDLEERASNVDPEATGMMDRVIRPFVIDPLDPRNLDFSNAEEQIRNPTAGPVLSWMTSIWDSIFNPDDAQEPAAQAGQAGAAGFQGAVVPGAQTAGNQAGAAAGTGLQGAFVPAAGAGGAAGGSALVTTFGGVLGQVIGVARYIGAVAGQAFSAAFNANAQVSAPMIGPPIPSGVGQNQPPPAPIDGNWRGTFAQGGDVPNDGLHYLHYKEMVLPRQYAETIRQMAGERLSGGAKVVHLGGVKVAETLIVRNDRDLEEIQAMLAEVLETYATNTSVIAAEA